MKVTTLQQNLLNRVPHENDGTILYTYFHEGRWLSTTKLPIGMGKDTHGREMVEIEVQAVYDDAETMLQAHRENGYHAWKRTV